MKSFSPAGMAIKAFTGLGARTFGNPSGATSGNGAATFGAPGWGVNNQAIPNPEAVIVLDALRAVVGGGPVGGPGSGEIDYTTDGAVTWNTAANTSNRLLIAQFAANTSGTIVAYGETDTNRVQLSRSTDGGATWTDVSPATTDFDGTQYGNTAHNCIQWNATINRFVCFASNQARTQTRCFSSADGLTWTGALLASVNVFIGSFRIVQGVVIVGGEAVAPQPDAIVIDRSTNGGLSWTNVLHVAAPASGIGALEFNGSKWCAVGSDVTNSYDYTSPNGIDWTLQVTAPFGVQPPYWDDMAALGGVFMTVSDNTSTHVGTSYTNGLTWANVAVPNGPFRVSNIAGTVFAFGGGISASIDGVNWISQLPNVGGIDVEGIAASGQFNTFGVLALAVGLDSGGNPTIWKWAPVPTSLTFQLTPGGGPSSNGPYQNPNNSTWSGGHNYGSGQPHGSNLGTLTPPEPLFISSAQMVAFGSIESTGASLWITVCVLTAVAQDFFSSVTYTDTNGDIVVLSSATADYNTMFDETGYTIWAWQRGMPGVPDFDVANNENITFRW